MKYYKLIFRSGDRKDSSGYSSPSFRLQLPSNAYGDNKPKSCRVVLEKFDGFFADNTQDEDFCVNLVLQNQKADNYLTTMGADTFENSSIIDTITYSIGGVGTGSNDKFFEFRNDQDYSDNQHGYKLASSIFDNGTLMFSFQFINGTSAQIPNDADLQNYRFSLGVYVD